MELPRYLVPFDLQQLPRLECDVLVIGSGVGGLRLALEAARERSVLLVTKGQLRDSSSDWAQGGIACASDAADVAAHVADTLRVGEGLCDAGVVEALVGAAPAAIEEMIALGARFDRDAAGELARGLEGGHSSARILHAGGDATGAELVAALVAAVEGAPGLRILEQTMAVDLLTDDDGRCRGALLFTRHGEFQQVAAQVTGLATGGYSRLFRESTNPRVSTGDGLVMAYRAGAELADLELVQFHPTCLYVAGAPRSLISEAVRGAGAQLCTAAGERFMTGVHPDAELAPRDVVSRAIMQRVQAGEEVSLDLRHLDVGQALERFTMLARLSRDFGLDLRTETIPVRPAAHYTIGGVAASADGRTSLPGLVAVGEAACSGFHGANRLASNSLLEALVCGERAGRRAIADSGGPPPPPLALSWHVPPATGASGPLDMNDLEASLKSTIWRHVGILRSASGMRAAQRQLRFWGRYMSRRTFLNPAGWSLQNMLQLASLVTEAALAREESRGVHARADYPDKQPQPRHSVQRHGQPIAWREGASP